MVLLTTDELTEVRLAIAARARMTGQGTKPHSVCNDVLRKMIEADQQLAREAASRAVTKVISAEDEVDRG